ncbi:gamma-aminobutyric acid type B receptor subunit 1-like [Glandiceps talaboti]
MADRFVLVFAAVFAVLSVCMQDVRGTTPLYIGCILPLSGGFWEDIGYESLHCALQAIEDINNNTDVLPDYELHLVCNDSQGDIAITLEAAVYQVFDPPQPKVMVFGGIMSTVTIPMARVLGLWHLPLISPLATAPTLSDRENFPYFYRTHPSQYVYNYARLAICRDLGWTKVATLYQNHEKFSVAMDKFHDELVKLNMTLLTSESFDLEPTDQITRIKRLDVRIIAGAFYQDRALKVFCEAYKLGMYGPKYVWMIPSRWLKQGWWLANESVSCTLDELVLAIDGMIGMDVNTWDTSGQATVSGKTSTEIKLEYETKYSVSNGYGSLSYDGIWSMALALNNSVQRFSNGDGGYLTDGSPKKLQDFKYSDTEMIKLILEEMDSLSFHGVSGLVSFDENGERQGYIKIEQNNGGSYRTIGYFDSRHDVIEWLLDKETIFNKSGGRIPSDAKSIHHVVTAFSLSGTVFVTMAMLASIGIVLCVILLIFNIYNRDKRVIKMSSPNLNNAVILGCSFIYLFVLVYGLDLSEYDFICMIQIGLFATGFTLSFGAMFSKTWRVYKIFTNKSAKRMSIKDYQLFGLLGLLLLIDTFILLLWLLVDRPYASPHRYGMKLEISAENDDIAIETEEISYHCNSSHYSTWSAALIIYKGLLLLFGAFLTFTTRKVNIPALNDSRYVALSVYNVVTVSFIGLPVTTFLLDKPEESYIILASLLIYCTSATMGLIFVPKIIMVRRAGKISTDTVLNTTLTMDVQATTLHCDHCKTLKKQIYELEQKLKEESNKSMSDVNEAKK